MRFRVLGRLEVERDGRLIKIGRRRERCLLGVLLLEANAAVPVDRLVELLWDGEPPQDARAALRTHVSRLRTLLATTGDRGVEVAHATGGYLVRVDAAAVDALRFRHLLDRARDGGSSAERATLLRRALGLWRGPLLDDAASERVRERLGVTWQERRLVAWEEAIEAELACGRHRDVVGELGELCAEYPYRERFTGLLMVALYRCGRQAEALEAFGRLDRGMRQHLGLDPGPEIRELHHRILDGNPDVLAGPTLLPGDSVPASPTARPGPRPPRQLPPDTRMFTGRHPELARLKTLIGATAGAASPSTVVISAIDGMAGVGKTTLALHLAHALADRFPDGQLFTDLHGHTQGYPPRSAGNALDSFLRALGVSPQQIPEDTEERAALYRQRLTGTRTLVVLDNAASEAQVRPLIPSDGECLVLITSRRRLRALTDAHTLALDTLPAAEASALLCTVSGPDRVTPGDPLLAEIADLCGRLPLALRIAAALLRHRPAWSLDHLTGLLREHRLTALADTENDLATVFDLSYRHLTANQQRLFWHLGLLPGPDTDPYAVAALLDTDPPTARLLLEQLVDDNLLIQRNADRYQLHDLLRSYAQTLAATQPAQDRDTALNRLLDYYLHTTRTSDRFLGRLTPVHPPGPTEPPRHQPVLDTLSRTAAWISAELPNLEAAADLAATRDRPDHAVTIPTALYSYLWSRGPWALGVRLYSQALRVAERTGSAAGQACALQCLGHMLLLSGDNPGAVHAQTRALDLFRRAGNRLGEANVTIRLAEAVNSAGDHATATKALDRALRLYQELGDQPGQAYALSNLGRAHQMTGNATAAADALSRAVELFEELGNLGGLADALTIIGDVERRLGDHVGAVKALRQALRVSRELGAELIQANALMQLGHANREAGDHPAAVEDLQQALVIYQRLGVPIGEASTLSCLGDVRRLSGDLAEGRRLQDQALDLFRQVGDRDGEAQALNYYGALVTDGGDPAGAIGYHEQALRMARAIGSRIDEADALRGIGEARVREGNPAVGIPRLGQALDIYQRLGLSAAHQLAERLAELTPDGTI